MKHPRPCTWAPPPLDLGLETRPRPPSKTPLQDPPPLDGGRRRSGPSPLFTFTRDEALFLRRRAPRRSSGVERASLSPHSAMFGLSSKPPPPPAQPRLGALSKRPKELKRCENEIFNVLDTYLNKTRCGPPPYGHLGYAHLCVVSKTPPLDLGLRM